MTATSAAASTSSVGSSEPSALLLALEDIARRAGDVILGVYRSDFTVRGKADASPVTEADEAAERLIMPALLALGLPWTVVAEEAASRGEAPDAGGALNDGFWLVDPLDGTREFVSRNGEFTVNIALVRGGLPVLGVVFVPVHDRLYMGELRRASEATQAGEAHGGAWLVEGGVRRAIRCRAAPADGVTLACSRSHGDEAAMAAWLQAQHQQHTDSAPLVVRDRMPVGSSLKFGLIAAGQADVYPRLGRTMEWDTAAGHAVLAAAGGSVTDLDGRPLRYGKPGFENPHFVARGLTALHNG